MSDQMVENIRRLLFLVSYVAKQGRKGMLVERASKAAGFQNERDFFDAVRFVNMIGPPGGGPDEYILLEVQNGRVYAYLPVGFSRPPRLSLSEAAAVLAAAEPLRHSNADVLTSAIKKLRRAVPADCAPALEELARAASIQATPGTRWQRLLEDAIAQRMEVRLKYFTPKDTKPGWRVVEPRSIFTQVARWYLVAWSVKDGVEKLYRLDRILDAEVGTRCFGQHKGTGSPSRTVLFSDAEMHPEVQVRFAKRLARLAHEQFGPLASDEEDGSVVVKTRMANETYAVNWALGYGGAVRIVSPAGWQKTLEKRAKELLARHG